MNSNKTYLQVDVILLILLGGILTIGLLAVSSTTQARFGNFQPFLIKQAGAAVVGGVAAWWIWRWDYHFLPQISKYIYIVNIGLLAAVLVLGHSALGAQRWIGLGPITIQPSETAKLLSILTLAVALDRQERFDRWTDLAPALLHILPAFGLIFLQPDLGTALVFVVTLFAMLYAAGYPGWKLSLIGGIGLAIIVGWIVLHLRYHVKIPLKEYQLDRLIVFMDPQVDPSGLGYQISEAKVAIGTGGLFGQGLFHGVITHLNYLPEQFTDFIFSSISEELGFLGAGTLLLGFALLLSRIFRIAALARDRLGTLLAVGVGTMLAFHIVENVGMNLSLMPVAGIPLPFVSYGGSAMAMNVTAMGVVLSVWRHHREIQF
ncbi:MAG: rod shape-determining protein RodA [Mycobacterium leprae]